MKVIETAATGVVNEETIFHFSQKDQYVEAHYKGGKIRSGSLIGILNKDKLEFCYCQIQTDGTMDHGSSNSILSLHSNGKKRLVEHFKWGSRPGETGTNVFEEV